MKESITILGATGSIGCNALEVIDQHPQRYQVFALTGNHNIELLAKQCLRFRPKYAVVANGDSVDLLNKELKNSSTQVLAGADALLRVVSEHEVDTVIAGIVGIPGLVPTLTAAREGKRILLANKEVLIAAGKFFVQAIKENGAVIMPVDSEHNAVYQCLEKKHQTVKTDRVRKIILTASGGPFLRLPLTQLSQITPEQACAHPNWSMGAKISVDSATMMNKGLEVIEAHWLFGLPLDQIEILIHPQSIVHALVVFEDGSTIAQMSYPDMRVAIAYALSGSDRIPSGVEDLDLAKCRKLEFQAVDYQRFPCVKIAHEAFAQGEIQTIALNAANEIAVYNFLNGKLGFDKIPEAISETIEQMSSGVIENIEQVLAVDAEARMFTQELIKRQV